ncbi:hypothetical protein SAMN05216525_115111 [Bradyrhizobium sp. Gha]|nr:hypothetical protein SAMN05216525_115111 [Bradyrhizobium sp. Gha]
MRNVRQQAGRLYMLALPGIAPIDTPDVARCVCIEGETNDKKANQWACVRR